MISMVAAGVTGAGALGTFVWVMRCAGRKMIRYYEGEDSE